MHVVRAILLMILAMALLALSDVFIKLSTQAASHGQVMLAVSALGTCVLAAYAAFKRSDLFSWDILHPMVLTRCFFEILASFGLIFALSSIDISTFAAIMQTSPILVVLGGALFLGEEVGWRRWAAVLAGLIGMLIVIRPGSAAFQTADLWAVMGVSALAARDLVTRLSPAHISSAALSTWGFAVIVPAGTALVLFEGEPLLPPVEAFNVIVWATLFTTAGYLSITTAMRLAPVSRVAPFRYTRLIFSAALGIAVFGERPDGPTLLGASIILSAGLYTFYREHKLAREGQQT